MPPKKGCKPTVSVVGVWQFGNSTWTKIPTQVLLVPFFVPAQHGTMVHDQGTMLPTRLFIVCGNHVHLRATPMCLFRVICTMYLSLPSCEGKKPWQKPIVAKNYTTYGMTTQLNNFNLSPDPDIVTDIHILHHPFPRVLFEGVCNIFWTIYFI